jgi:hypothetical protein
MSTTNYFSNSYESNDNFDYSNDYIVEINQNCSYDNTSSDNSTYEQPELQDKSGAEFEWDTVDYGGVTVDDGLF